MPTPPWTWTVVCASRWPASAAQSFATATSLRRRAGPRSSRQAACHSVSRCAEHVDVAVGQPLRDRLEGADRAAELLAGLGVRRRSARSAPSSDAELLGAHGHGEPLGEPARRCRRRRRCRRAPGRAGRGAGRARAGRPTSPSLSCCGTTVTPGSSGCDQEDGDARRRLGGHEEQVGVAVPAGTTALLPVSSQPSPSVSARGGRARSGAYSAVLGDGARSGSTRRAPRRAASVPAGSSVPNSASASAVDGVRRRAARGDRAADLDQHAGTARAGRARCRRAPRAAPGASRPASAELGATARGRTGRRPASTAFSRSVVAWSSRILAASSAASSCSGVKVKSMSCRSSIASRRGQAEADVADDVALDLVGAAAEGHHQRGAVEALEPAGEHGAGGVAGDAGVRADDLHQRAVDLGGQLGAVDLGRRRVGGGEVLGRREASFQLSSVSISARACARPSSDLHPLGVDHPAAVGVAWSAAPSRVTSLIEWVTGAAEVSATRSWLSWLVISAQPPLSSPTRLSVGHADVLVVGRAGADAGDGVHRRVGEARRRRPAPGSSTGPCGAAGRGRCGRPARSSRRTGSARSTSSGR